MTEKFDRSERATEPDLESFPCPSCQDERGVPQGTILTTVWSSESEHTSVERACTVCAGKKEISRERLAWYRALPKVR